MPKFSLQLALLIPCIAAALLAPSGASAQLVDALIVEIKTKDALFAGTDDSIYINFAGVERKLDTPNHDDFERGNTDTFTLDFSAAPLDFSIVRQIREFSIRKPSNSFFGGGWDFEAITLRVQFADPHADPADPIYINTAVDVELDEGTRSWTPGVDDAGWNFPPEPPTWPPCTVVIVEFGGSLPDADCDGIPDASDPTFDQPADQDGDGLPDLYETQTGTSPTDPDFDDDGWHDGNNRRHALLLRSVENDGTFPDVVNVVVEDIRFPAIEGLEESWTAPSGDRVPVNFVVDRRAAGAGTTTADNSFISRVRITGRTLNGANPFPFDTSVDVRWPAAAPIVVEVPKLGGQVRLTLQSILLAPFLDRRTFMPDGVTVDPDQDGDGLDDALEFAISAQDASTRPSPMDGYSGLADPGRQDLFVEIDTSGSDHTVQAEAKIRVATRFFLNEIAPKFDDGYLGGGQVHPHEAPITIDDLRSKYKCHTDRFWRERFSHFHYMLSVDRMTDTLSDTFGGGNGRADRPGANLVISRQTMLGEFGAIVFIHELGHNLSLCHPVGTREPPSPSPVCEASGDPPAAWSGCRNYCGVGDDDVTAMGDDVGLDSIIAGAAGGALIGASIGAAFGGVGAIVGGFAGLVGGALLGFLNSDAWLRVIDYHPNEWVAVKNKRTVSGVYLRPGLDITFPQPPATPCGP
jgi:PLAT/LH2 domain